MSDAVALTKQFNREVSLTISGASGQGIDLSQFRIKFAVKRSESATPNTADIYVYNLDLQTALQIGRHQEFSKIILQAGYPGNKGVIFKGNIVQAIIGRENATDTFINILSSDGDRAYNFAVVNKSFAKGTTAKVQVDEVVSAMTPKGVTAGHIGDLPVTQLPRGKVLFGAAKDVARNIAKSTQNSWSIQDEQINFVYKTAYLPGPQVKISAATGMIGTPQQTNEGVNVKTLLNPDIQISRLVLLDNSTVLQEKLNLDQLAAARGDTKQVNTITPRKLNADGAYYVLALEHRGDTRGIEWYTSLICVNQDASLNPRNSVTGGTRG